MREYPSTSSFPGKLCHLLLGEDVMEGFPFTRTPLAVRAAELMDLEGEENLKGTNSI